MKKIYLDAAERIYNKYCIKSNHIGSDGKIRQVGYIVCVDDDVTSALWAVYLYYWIRAQYGYCPTILCVGGSGLLSKYTYNKSEAEILAYACMKLGVPEQNIRILPNGKNSGDNVMAVYNHLGPVPEVVWAVTKRLSLRIERTQAKQAPDMKAFYYVIEETFNEACKVSNGRALGKKLMMMQEIASIKYRCEQYAKEGPENFQAPVLFVATRRDNKDAALLEKYFRLKLSLHTNSQKLRAVAQFAVLWCGVKLLRSVMEASIEEDIWTMFDILSIKGFAGIDEMPVYLERRVEVPYHKQGVNNGLQSWPHYVADPDNPDYEGDKPYFGYHRTFKLDGFKENRVIV